LKNTKASIQILLVLFLTGFCSSCATTVGITAAALTSATISVGTAIVTAPFKIIGAMDGEDDEDEPADIE
jgi:hypothetical protein